MKSAIRYDAYQKLLNAPMTDFDPAVLLAAKHTSGSGYLVELERLYSTMFHEWSTLQKDVSDTMEAVSALDWTVAPYVEAGQRASKRAAAVAETVSRAIWHGGEQEPGTFAHGFLDLVGSMLDGIYRGVCVHEVIWRRDAKLVYPAEYRQVPGQYYVWETREGERDRLLMVRDGFTWSEAEVFPRYRFIIAMNTTGSDHPIYNAVYYSLLGYFVAAKYGLPWMQEYCKRYGHPVRKFRCESEGAAAALRAQIAAAPDVSDVFLVGPDADMEVTPVPAGASIPHEALLRVAENACHQAILGQTLTSDTGDAGGSRAQAEVHMGVQRGVVQKRAEYVARVLNRQLIPAIVAMNYGRVEGVPLPELKFALPDDGANVERADYWARVLALPGVKVAREVVYESLRIPMPGEGEDTLGGTSDQLPVTSGDNARPSGAGKGDDDDDDDDDDDPEPPKGGRKLEVGSRKSDSGGDAAEAAHCNQHGHVPGCSGGGAQGVSLANDTTGLQAHLNDVVEPVEVSFAPVRVNLKQLLREGKTEEYNRERKRWLLEFKEYYQTQLAGKTIEVKGSGYSMHFPESGDATKRAAKGVRNQTRAEVGKNMIEAVENSYHLHQGIPEHKDGESEQRRKMVEKADAFHVFGCPISINGERTLMWMAATHRKDEKSPKQLVFYEFGVAESKKKADGAPLVHGPNPHRAGTPPARATLLDVLRDVKSDFEGKPKIAEKKDGAEGSRKDEVKGGCRMLDVGCRMSDSGAQGARNLSTGHSSLVTSNSDVAERLAVEARGAWVAPVVRKLREWKEEGLSLAEMRERLREVCPDTDALARGLAEAFAAGLKGGSKNDVGMTNDEVRMTNENNGAQGARNLSIGHSSLVTSHSDVAGANPGGCNQHGHAPGCKHGRGGWSSGTGGSGKAPHTAADDGKEPWERRQEERERLEALLSELERQEEAEREDSAMESAGYTQEERRRQYDEEAARERWAELVREGDPTTREGIERRLAELDAEDAAEDDVSSANPYGCNQYGEGWCEPHDGNSTSYQQMGPGKPERKVLTTEHGGNKVAKVSHEKHPGKGAYEHADDDSLDKTAKEEREKREREKASEKPSAGVDTFAERIEKAVDKVTADRFREQMANAPEEARALFEKYKGEIKIEATKNGSSCIMKIPPIVALNLVNNNVSNGSEYRVPGQTLLHEIGHALDRHAGNSICNLSPQLQESIDADVKEVFARKRKELEMKYGRKMRIGVIRDELGKELDDLKTGLGPITDAFGGHGVRTAFGHSQNYYKTKPGAGHVETFANLYAAHILQDKKMLESIKKYLPRTYERFIGILKEHTKGA